MIRITSGKYKNRRLSLPKREKIRPTTDQIREAVFSSLGDRVVGADCVDLCAGTGAFGIEALSRGARSAAFVDSSVDCARTIRANLEGVGVEEDTRVLRSEAVAALNRMAGEAGSFDLIFADPPYESKVTANLVAALQANPSLLKPNGAAVFEHRREEFAGIALNSLTIFWQRRYGDTQVTMLHRI